jgi:hypothetical protein
MAPAANALEVQLRQIMAPLKQEILRLRQEQEALKDMAKRPRTIQEEIDAIPGRRLFYTLSNSVTFTADLDGRQGPPVTMLVSQDGPFVMTHYPMMLWKPSLPTNATDFGRWRPVTSYPLPDQVLDDDIIDVSYQFIDTGSQRNFQSNPVPAGLLSTPDNLIPLPCPTLFTPNTSIQVVPTYENILFSAISTPATQGTLVVALPGYRIVNM